MAILMGYPQHFTICTIFVPNNFFLASSLVFVLTRQCDGHKPCTRCLHDNKICTYSVRNKKPDDKSYPPGYMELLEDRVVLLQKALREFIRKLAVEEDLSFILPVGRHTTKDGDVAGRFSVNLVLDKLGIKLLDDNDPINNNDVLKDIIVLHKVNSSPPGAGMEDESGEESLPVLKVKRGRPPKKQPTLKKNSPTTSIRKQPSRASSAKAQSELKRASSDDVSAIDEQHSMKYSLDDTGSFVEPSCSNATIINTSLPQSKRMKVTGMPTNNGSDYWNLFDYSNKSSTSESSIEDDIFTSSSSSTPRSAHIHMVFKDSATSRRVTDDKSQAPQLHPSAMLAPEANTTSTDHPLIASLDPTQGVFDLLENQEFQFLEHNVKDTPDNVLDRYLMTTDIPDMALPADMFSYSEIIGTDFSKSGMF